MTTGRLPAAAALLRLLLSFFQEVRVWGRHNSAVEGACTKTNVLHVPQPPKVDSGASGKIHRGAGGCLPRQSP